MSSLIACPSAAAQADQAALEEHAAEIRRLLGIEDDDPAERDRRCAIYRAQENAACCAQCQRPIAAGEPIWRNARLLGPGFFGGWSYTVAPVCADCKSDLTEFRRAAPCEGCGRQVHNEHNFRSHSRTFCCKQCEHQAYAAEARRQRAEARGLTRTCVECGETFAPKRSDSRFCSAACKQKAYRRRVTDNASAAGNALESRNALPITKACRRTISGGAP
jgi:hypothetical protein